MFNLPPFVGIALYGPIIHNAFNLASDILYILQNKSLAPFYALCIVQRMKQHRDIIPTDRIVEIASVTGKSVHTVTSWRQRNSIPADVWAALVRLKLTTLDELANAREAKAA